MSFGQALRRSFFVKLDRSNFPSWKTMITPVIKGHKLEGFLLGTTPRPSKNIMISEAGQEEAQEKQSQFPNMKNRWIVIYRTVRHKPHSFPIIKPSGIKSRPAPERLLWWVMSRNVVDTAVVNHGTVMRKSFSGCLN
ncbi:Uncharacterized protein Fot_57854 [Forsythia ovata]|uniref:Retrotransposon Copia-like N-terminal domain-containing protein n=1 Tax=Forsythia ovata TaxID=205694 RepID=A0ABD1NU15_9LAMI